MENITETEYEIAKNTIRIYEENKTILDSLNNPEKCSRCGSSMSQRWEQAASFIRMEIGVCSQSTTKLFGAIKHDLNNKHPAISDFSMQRVKININTNKDLTDS